MGTKKLTLAIIVHIHVWRQYRLKHFLTEFYTCWYDDSKGFLWPEQVINRKKRLLYQLHLFSLLLPESTKKRQLFILLYYLFFRGVILGTRMFVMFKSRTGGTAERPLRCSLGVHEETSPFFPIRPFFLRQTAGWCWLRPRCRMQFMGQNTVMRGRRFACVGFFFFFFFDSENVEVAQNSDPSEPTATPTGWRGGDLGARRLHHPHIFGRLGIQVHCRSGAFKEYALVFLKSFLYEVYFYSVWKIV